MGSPPILRVARPTNDIGALLGFYWDGLGFSKLAAFEDHEGFDGVMLGHEHWPYHFEFSSQRGQRVALALSRDNMLVFYLPNSAAWQAALDRMARAGVVAVAAANPDWDRLGRTFKDPDGYRVVLQNTESPV